MTIPKPISLRVSPVKPCGVAVSASNQFQICGILSYMLQTKTSLPMVHACGNTLYGKYGRGREHTTECHLVATTTKNGTSGVILQPVNPAHIATLQQQGECELVFQALETQIQGNTIAFDVCMIAQSRGSHDRAPTPQQICDNLVINMSANIFSEDFPFAVTIQKGAADIVFTQYGATLVLATSTSPFTVSLYGGSSGMKPLLQSNGFMSSYEDFVKQFLATQGHRLSKNPT